nr:antibiotic biosynthesis monooxygenase family protein [Kribbella italica]
MVRAEFVVRDGAEQELLELVRGLQGRVAEEPGTLRYDWFRGPSYVVVLEEYADSAAVVRHQEHVGDLLAKVFAVAELRVLQVHGDVDAALQEVLDGLPVGQVFPPLG